VPGIFQSDGNSGFQTDSAGDWADALNFGIDAYTKITGSGQNKASYSNTGVNGSQSSDQYKTGSVGSYLNGLISDAFKNNQISVGAEKNTMMYMVIGIIAVVALIMFGKKK